MAPKANTTCIQYLTDNGSCAGFLTRGKIGVFILDAMDTLLVMGMHDEYVKAREWVEKDLSFDVVCHGGEGPGL
jgi:hypothetical protein